MICKPQRVDNKIDTKHPDRESPSPARIRQMTARIRRRWSAATRESRWLGERPTPAQTQVVRVRDLSLGDDDFLI
jgi:hypothetical protein